MNQAHKEEHRARTQRLKGAEMEAFQEKRRQAYFKLQEILAEDQPYTFLYWPDALPAISKRFHGIKPALAGIDYNFIKWYVPRADQKYTMSPY